VNDRLYPYLVDPKETPAIWGGDALVRRYGKRGDPAARIGESWECWDDNRVVNGALTGRTVGELRTELGAELTGPIDPARPFPVLTKIIDAHAPLSVQVHPDDAYAQRVEHQPNGKTECWYVLACDSGAEIVLGWSRDTSRDEVAQRVADGTLAEIMRRVPVAPGSVYYLPAGTVHAIGAGIQLFETQQTSDLTYRLFDWNRVGDDGKPRELHVAKALDVLDYRAATAGALRSLTFDEPGLRRTLLIADRNFAVERIDVTGGETSLETGGLPLTITTLGSHLRVDASPIGGSAVIEPWSTVVTPAACERLALFPGGEPTAALVVHPRPRLDALRHSAQAAGRPAAELDGFAAQFAEPKKGER
jgi:mannose-6-phosphate isomerase